MFPTLLYLLFCISSLAFVFALILFWRNLPSWLNVAREIRSVGLFFSMLVFVALFVYMHSNIVEWMESYELKRIENVEVQKEEKQELKSKSELKQEERAYVERVYPQLLKEQDGLANDIKDILERANRLEQLSRHHPSNQALLINSLSLMHSDMKKYAALYKAVEVEITNAYIHAAVQNTIVIDEKFSIHAAKLHHQLLKAREGLKKNLRKVGMLVDNRLMTARKRLQSRNIRKEDRSTLQFSNEVQSQLWAYIQKREEEMSKSPQIAEGEPVAPTDLDTTIHQRAKWFLETRNGAIAKRDKLDYFREKTPQLEAPLIKTMALWQAVEDEAFDYIYELLYAIEVAYLAEQLDMPARSPNLVRLDRALDETTRQMEKKLKGTVTKTEQSFSLPSSAYLE